MFRTIKYEIKYLVSEWYKYMDTTVPQGIDGQLFTHLKYSNKNRIKQLQTDYPDINLELLEKHALHEYLKNDNKKIVETMKLYKVES